MKLLKYILLAILLCSVFAAKSLGVTELCRNKNVVFYLECVDDNPKKSEIVESVIVFKNRLKSAGIRYKISLKDDNTIRVVVKNKDLSEAQSLLLANGSLGFYLPYLNQDGIENILANERLSAIYNDEVLYTDMSGSFLLGVLDENKSEVERFFKDEILSKAEYKDLVIAWSKVKSEADRWELHLLSNDNYLDGSYVEKSFAQSSMEMKAFEIMIVFSTEGAELWEELTANNVSRNLAIVLDGEVYSYPKIMDKISGGKAMISGNFSENEAEQLAALIQGGRLPLEYRIKTQE